jgi:mannobiose 2-epimerase
MLRNSQLAACAVLLSFSAAGAPAAEKQQFSRDWSKEFRWVLEENILKFWIEKATDREHGGTIGWLDREGRAIEPGTKSLVQQTRVVWTFAAAYREFPEPKYQEAAEHTLKFLRAKMFDTEDGGFYWRVSREGKVLEPKKHLYGQSFAIYALAEYARAFNDGAAREEALALFRLIDAKGHDAENGGYRESFTREWKPIRDDAMLGPAGQRTQNTHIHLLEAFTTLYAATGDATVRARLEELLRLFADRIVDSDRGFARLFFTDMWQPTDDATSSYGHDIELSWLMTEAAEALGGGIPSNVRRAALALAEHTLRHGFDRDRGGVFYEGPARGAPRDRQMSWWVQAEALVGFLNAAELSGNSEYREAFEKQARYTLENFVDREYGEWHHIIRPDGTLAGPKASDWKAPYHAGRACLEIYRRLRERP